MLRPLVGLLGAIMGVVISTSAPVGGVPTPLPNAPDSAKFAVIGDNGTGDRAQYEVAQQMVRARQRFPYERVLMVGDNFYGSQRPADLARKFELPYKALLDAGVLFYAALGNHDEPHTVNYPPLNMGGRRYYSLAAKNIRIYVLDTNTLDPPQLRWFQTELELTRERWKIAVFHHPLYGSARRHGGAVDLRVILEPLLVKYAVNVVFSGHDHVYERLKPQSGIHYFVCGSGGKLRKGDLASSPLTAKGFDGDQSFMLVEIDGDRLTFEVIARTGARVDSGVISRLSVAAGT